MRDPGTDGPTDPATARMVGVVAVAGVLLLAVAGAVVLDAGPSMAGIAPDSPATTTPDAGGSGGGDGGTGSGDGGTESGDGSGNGADHVRPFAMTIAEIEECGRTCRDVTAAITNNGGNPRAGVTVETEIRTGSDVVWEGSQSLGTLASGETVTRTQRVELGMLDAAKVRSNGGTVTVVTTVVWDDGSATYRERRQIA